jgi:DNA-binding transcriptional LysR family regulator
LRNRSVDLVLVRLRGRAGTDYESFDDFNVEILFEDEVVIAAGRESRWARRRKIDLAELIDEPWILAAPDAWNYKIIEEAFQTRGLNMPNVSLRTFSLHLRANLLTTGRFIATLPKSVLHLYANTFLLKELPIDLPNRPWPIGIVTLKNRTLSPVVERFIECAHEVTKSFANSK